MTSHSAFERNLEREREFMLRLGEAITTWQSVEMACFGVYSSLMKGANNHLISVTFFHIQSFESRLVLIDRCLFFAPENEPWATDWKKLRSRAANLAMLRNQIAHSAYIIEGRGEEQIPTLAPSYSDATALVRKRAMNPEYRIDASKLARARHDFDQLGADIRDFAKRASHITEKIAETSERRRAQSISAKSSK